MDIVEQVLAEWYLQYARIRMYNDDSYTRCMIHTSDLCTAISFPLVPSNSGGDDEVNKVTLRDAPPILQ